MRTRCYIAAPMRPRHLWPRTQLAVLCLSVMGLAACSGLLDRRNPDHDPSKPHHRPDGFVNRYSSDTDKPGLLRWQWERWRDGLPKPPAAPIVGVAPDLPLIAQSDGPPRVTWVGHATLLLQIDGVNLLTDPHWGERASPVSFAGPKRHQPPGIAMADLPRIDAVLISHNHFDHLDQQTLQTLLQRHPALRLYVPLGVQHWMAEHLQGVHLSGPKQNVFALDWDQDISLPGRTAQIRLELLAVQHWSARTPWDRFQTLWGSWAVLHPRFRFWFSGDLGYSRDTQDIGKRLGELDLAAIAIGAYAPRWFMKAAHLDPSEAVQVMKEVRARAALGIHWGTFEGLSDESLDQPPQDLAKALAQDGTGLDFRVLRHGQTWVLPPRP